MLAERHVRPRTIPEVPLLMSGTLVARRGAVLCIAVFHWFVEYAAPCSGSFQHLQRLIVNGFRPVHVLIHLWSKAPTLCNQMSSLTEICSLLSRVPVVNKL